MGRKRINPIKPPAYQFKVGNEVVYLGGIYSKYNGQQCEIIGRSKSKGTEWYRIKTDDGFEFSSIATVLRKEEEID